MTELSAYQDLMTYAVTRRADATALEDGEAIGCALAKHAHELAEKIRYSEALQDATDDHMGDCLMAADLIDPGSEAT